MEQQSFEGTWEELLQYAPELVGQRVRLTVLSNKTPNPHNGATLDQVLQGRFGRVQFQPVDLSRRTKAAFTDLMAEKYRQP